VKDWRGLLRSRRVGVLAILALGVLFVGLLASGVLSSATGGTSNAIVTEIPTVATSQEPGAEPQGGQSSFGRGDWGTYGGTFDEIRHSPLTQVAKQNVSQLGRVFSVDFRKIDPSIPKGQQSFPIVLNGTIFVTTGDDHVFAVDGGSGKVLWQYKPSDTGIFKNYGVNTNRGLAYCDGKLFMLTLDMRIVSLDPRTGALIKQVAISDAVPGAKVEYGYSETQAPICFRNHLIFGASGSDYGVRGFLMAYNPDLTPAWSSPYWIVPPDGQEWRSHTRAAGGGTNWNPVAIDPTTDTVYFTTSNPSPIFAPLLRPGPDPRTDSLIAVNLADGRQRWWEQQIAGDQWGYSTSQPPLVYTVRIGGVARRVVSVGTKEGTWFMYDARTGKPIYQRVKLLNHVEHAALVPGKPVTVYPSSLGGLNYSPSSFDPGTGYVINNQAETSSVLAEKLLVGEAERNKVRGDVDNGLSNGAFGTVPPGWRDYGSVSAVNAAKGVVAWKFVTQEPGRGGVTTTASGLGFAGGGDGVLRAFDDSTGNVLWSFQTGYQIASGPSIYLDHGKEYVAVTVGGTPTSSYGGTASQLQVFAIGGSATQSAAPPLRPPNESPGVLNAPTQYLSLGGQPHTLEVQVVAVPGANGVTTLDGSKAGQTELQLPAGWTVNVTVANQDPSHAGHVAVVPIGGSPNASQSAAFSGADSGRIAPNGVAYFHFDTSKQGDYAIASAGGQWIRLRIGASTSAPQLRYQGQSYAVDVTATHG
jgi:PQQ-dependent dehydrogenase (methanol/ethanol family)